MPQENVVVDVSQQPELLALARQVQRTGQQVMLLTDGEELARVTPARGSARHPRNARTSANDAFWDIVGMFDSGEPSVVSEQVDAVLAAWEVEGNRP